MLAGISGEKAPRSRRGKGDVAMGSTPLFSQRLRVALGVLCRRLQGGVSAPPPRMPQAPPAPHPPRRRRSTAPQPCPGRIHQPLCAACAQGAAARATAPGSPPPGRPGPRGRQRPGDTPTHCCPAPGCASRGGRGRGTNRATGPPGGKAWRQRPGGACHGDVLCAPRPALPRQARRAGAQRAGDGVCGSRAG